MHQSLSTDSTKALVLLQLAQKIEHCEDELNLAQIIRRAATILGAEAWMYIVFTRDSVNDPDESRYRFLPGLAAGWVQRYVGRRWYLTDKSLRYAQSNGQPARLSEIKSHTRGQKAMILEARNFGLLDGYVFPAHGALQNRVGALQLFWSDPSQIDRQAIQVLEAAMRTVVVCALEWLTAHARQELARMRQITQDDVMLLRYCSQGFTSREIALVLQSTPRVVDQRIARVMAKFNVSKRAHAISEALDVGLI